MSSIKSNLITNNEIASKCVEHQPDRLTGSPNENKRVFDEFPKLIATKFNNTIETLDSIVDSQSGSIEDNKSVINVLSARMDEFASLPDGSTSGNAELIDIRVGGNGKTYASAGDSVRGQISNLNKIAKRFNAYPISDEFITKSNGTHNGITYTWNNDGSCVVSGTSTNVSVNALLANSPLPSALVAGQTYKIKYKTTNDKVSLNFIFRKTSSGTPTYVNISHDDYFTIPADAAYMALRLYVANSGVDLTNPAVVSEIAIMTTETVSDLVDGIYYGKNKSSNIISGLTYFEITKLFSSSNPAEPSDIPVNSYCYTVGNRLTDFPVKSSAYYWVFCIGNLSSANVRQFIVLNANAGERYIGFTSDSGVSVTWQTFAWTELKVLHIGSSFGQDSVVYAPFITDSLASGIRLTMGLSYISGGSITQYNGYFDDNTQLSYFKRDAISNNWSSAQSKTLKQILTDEKWDIITFQQSAYDGGVWSTFTDLNAFIDKVVNYCMNQNGNGVKTGYIMPQAAIGYSSRYSYSNMVDCVQRVLDTTPIDFVIPCGTGIENARNTSLRTVGDSGNLAYDSTGHLQEGLPVLLSSYVTALKIMELCGIKNKGILGDKIRPTAEWVSRHNIPGQNGTSTGVTDANCLLAQKCAIAAIKKPFETSSIVE